MTLSKTIALVAVLGALTLSACGSESEGDTGQDGGSASSAPSGGPGGFADVDFEAIQECLSAAGLEDVLPTDLPTDMPTDRPTDVPTDRPSDFPTDGTPPEGFPSGGPGGGPGGGLAALQDPDVQAALEACGIELPQAPGGDQ